MSDPAAGILHDVNVLPQPRHELFEPAYWQQRNAATTVRGGRGNVLFINADEQHWVLRHYRRGGLIGKLIDDQYLWLGAAATRSFREWRLLAQLYAWDLPVPQPIAARYIRHGLSYRADLLTAAIVGARTLTACLAQDSLPMMAWRQLGETLARFHAAGVQHADLNAHNIVFDANNAVVLLDFDRGRMRAVQPQWINKVLQRLLRSLTKLQRQHAIHFSMTAWQQLRQAHDARLVQLRA